MKRFLRCSVAFALALLARAVVRRYRPRIVLVSGSVGKTSTKDAVAAALSARFLVRKSAKSFNSEFGVPFAILGVVGHPWQSRLAWLAAAKNALALLLLPNHYPTMLVLEAGADRPGDMARILRIAMPDAVIITRLPEVPAHVEAYASPEAVREEEFSPAYALPPAAPLVVPADDSWALDSASRTPARRVSYGVSADADARVSDVGFYESGGKVVGMRAKAHVAGEQVDLVVKGAVGVAQLLPSAAALALAGAFGISLSEALGALEKYEPPPGRGRLFAGINGSIIIDDSYNASPAAVEEALATLKAFPMRPYSAPFSPEDTKGHGEASKGRRIAVLGDMLELGRYSVEEHRRLGALAGASADVIAAVGIRARAFAAAAPERETLLFGDSAAAASALPEYVRAGDIVLVKGSQAVRTERIVEALLADPSDAARLVRQDRAWKRKS